jgi:hypothetical protein
MRRVLPTHYFHVVFTLPSGLHTVARRNRALVFDLLLRCAADTLVELGGDPKWLGERARLGVTTVLHTWTRDLRFHPRPLHRHRRRPRARRQPLGRGATGFPLPHPRPRRALSRQVSRSAPTRPRFPSDASTTTCPYSGVLTLRITGAGAPMAAPFRLQRIPTHL